MTDPQLLRDLGRLEEAVDNLTRQVEEGNDATKELTGEVSALKSRLDKLDGGRAALLGLLASAAAIGGLISLALQHLVGRGG